MLWRKRSFGSQSARRERFAERVMTTVRTARKQGKAVLDFMVHSITAHVDGFGTVLSEVAAEERHHTLDRVSTRALHDWSIRTVEINGKRLSTTSTRDTKYQPAEVLAFLSRSETIYPGELIATDALPNTTDPNLIATAFPHGMSPSGALHDLEIQGVFRRPRAFRPSPSRTEIQPREIGNSSANGSGIELGRPSAAWRRAAPRDRRRWGDPS